MKNDLKSGSNAASNPVIVSSAEPVTLLGGAPILPGDLARSLALAPELVAADGGAVQAVKAGHVPRAVIGDLDSFDPATYPEVSADRVHHIPEQTSTDFDKALRNIAAPVVLALGFTGARIDHELAAYHTLVRHPERPCIVIGAQDIIAHLPRRLSLQLPVGTRLSLFPMRAVTGQSIGLAWPIDDLAFHPADRIGTSNVTTEAEVVLATDGPGFLLILPREHLGALIAALIASFSEA